MVTHEFTVFADGHVDGEAAARCGDRKSHTLHFVLAQGLTASAAKLLLWPAGATTPTQYEQVLAEADAVSFTPTTWEGVGMTTAQLELLNSAGDVSWQSRRFAIPVEAGAPDETLPPLVDISDATAETGDVRRGKTFYAAAEKQTGAWDALGFMEIFLPITLEDNAPSVITFRNWSSDVDYYTMGVDMQELLFFKYTPSAYIPDRFTADAAWLYLDIIFRRDTVSATLDGETLDLQKTQNMLYLLEPAKVSTQAAHELTVVDGRGSTRTFKVIPYDEVDMG